MTFGIQKQLVITICDDAADAVRQGFNYTRDTHLPVEIERAVIVKDGTESGRATVDLVIVDEMGQHFVVMITGRLLKMITEAII